MSRSLRSLPPSRSFVVFEAAGRLLNFSAAAREIGISQAAVSKQIQGLETDAGVRLFTRSNRGLALTNAGRHLHQAVSTGLTHIHGAMQQIRPRHREGRISVTTTIAAASEWLMPRIARFRAEHPSVDLRVVATDAALDLSAEAIDIAVRYGMGHWPGTTSRKLFGIELFPVCSPSYLVGRTIETIGDLREATLLHVDEPNSMDAEWNVWLRSVGADPITHGGGLRFNNYPLLIQAAVSGHGVALGWGNLLDDVLGNGSLVRCLRTTVALEPAFYVVTPDEGHGRPEVQAFVDWILGETETLR